MKIPSTVLTTCVFALHGISNVVADPDATATLTSIGGSLVKLRIDNKNLLEDLYILKSGLPDIAAPSGEELFLVTREDDGTEVTFMGIAAKSPPEVFPDDYEVVPPAGYIEVEYDVARDYDLSTTGTHEVSYKLYDPELACNPTGTICLSEIPSNTVLINGRRLRQNFLQERRLDTVADVNDPMFPVDTSPYKCSKMQKDMIKQAKKDAFKCVWDSIDCLDDLTAARKHPHFQMWFGNHNDKDISDVKDNFKIIKEDLKGDLTFCCGGPSCKDSWWAYVHPNDSTKVHLCKKFWESDPKGKDSKMGTLVHEVAHYRDGCNFNPHFATGQTQCKERAMTQPANMRKNCDSYEYFCECLPQEGRGGVWGDPHFRTWHGTNYEFHGECDLVLLHAPDFKFASGVGLDIHIRTKVRYHYSYIESAAIRVGEEVLQISSYGQYFLNGVSQGDLQSTTPGMNITHEQMDDKEHRFTIGLGHGIAIMVKTFKDIVNVNLDSSNGNLKTLDWLESSTGLMGSFGDGEMMARDGVTILEDPNEFGQEWMVLDREPHLFEEKDRYPQYPEKCVLPSADKAQVRRRLEGGISMWDAEKACSHHSDHQARDACISDAIALDDLELANRIAY